MSFPGLSDMKPFNKTDLPDVSQDSACGCVDRASHRSARQVAV